MKLPPDDARLFVRLHKALIYYAYLERKNISAAYTDETVDAWWNAADAAEDTYTALVIASRNYVYDHPGLIDRFIEKNPFDLPAAHLEIVAAWKQFVRDEFFISRHLKNHTVFVTMEGDPKAYGVIGLTESLKDKLDCPLPFVVNAVLLPFGDRIVYDGLLFYRNVIFGSGIKPVFNRRYMDAKTRYGIITSLPFTGGEQENEAEMLRFYLKSAKNRERFEEEIFDILERNPHLEPVYLRELGKAHARNQRKTLRKMGLSGAWFAAMGSCIVASGASKKELQRNLRTVLPAGREDAVFLFNVK